MEGEELGSLSGMLSVSSASSGAGVSSTCSADCVCDALSGDTASCAKTGAAVLIVMDSTHKSAVSLFSIIKLSFPDKDHFLAWLSISSHALAI